MDELRVRVEEDLHAALRAAASARGVPEAEVARQLLRRGLALQTADAQAEVLAMAIRRELTPVRRMAYLAAREAAAGRYLVREGFADIITWKFTMDAAELKAWKRDRDDAAIKKALRFLRDRNAELTDEKTVEISDMVKILTGADMGAEGGAFAPSALEEDEDVLDEEETQVQDQKATDSVESYDALPEVERLPPDLRALAAVYDPRMVFLGQWRDSAGANLDDFNKRESELLKASGYWGRSHDERIGYLQQELARIGERDPWGRRANLIKRYKEHHRVTKAITAERQALADLAPAIAAARQASKTRQVAGDQAKDDWRSVEDAVLAARLAIQKHREESKGERVVRSSVHRSQRLDPDDED